MVLLRKDAARAPGSFAHSQKISQSDSTVGRSSKSDRNATTRSAPRPSTSLRPFSDWVVLVFSELTISSSLLEIADALACVPFPKLHAVPLLSPAAAMEL